MVITTTCGNILTYSISQSISAKEIAIFTYSDNSPLFIFEGQPIRTAFPGPGEAGGVREMFLQFTMIVRLYSGISLATALDNYLLIATKSPPAIQLVKWKNNESSNMNSNGISDDSSKDVFPSHETRTAILSQLPWFSNKYNNETSHKSEPMIVHNSWNKQMRLFSWVFSDGSVWVVTMDEAISNGKVSSDCDRSQLFNGHCLHKPLVQNSLDDFSRCAEINARFSLVAVGCTSGRIYIYNIKDYSGHFVQVRILEPPAPSAGPVNTISSSGDGYGWFVGYESGWAFFSVFGMLNASSFISSADQRAKEKWMDGIEKAVWSFSGDSIYLLPKEKTSIWLLDTLRWNAAGNFIQSNISHTVLYKDSKIMMYRGQNQPDLSTIDKDTLLWLNVPIPASYIAENWPIKYVSCSTDGNFIAVAGVRGVTHYSLNSGRWKLFVEEDNDRDITVRGGILWYGNVLILAVDTGSSHEIQLYLRELELDSQNILYRELLPSAAINIFIIGNSLFVYTAKNLLYQYNILVHERQISLELVSEISFTGIIHSPGRVRSISCIPKNDPNKVPFILTDCSILLLIDGMLIQLTPRIAEASEQSDRAESTNEMKYRFKILHNYVEYYSFSGSQGEPRNMIWAFDGQEIIIWTHGIYEHTNTQELMSPTFVPMELYPLTMLSDKGIIMGIDCDAVLTRSGSFTYFKQWTSAQLFLPYILKSYLHFNKFEKALLIANKFRHLKYFEHMLEVLLYDVIVNQTSHNERSGNKLLTEDMKDNNNPLVLLKSTLYLISQFPQMPEVIVGCTRKTEIKYWKKLFSVLGSPQKLFEKCIETGNLSTAGGYLLVLHYLDQDSDKKQSEFDASTTTMDNTAKLLKVAGETQNWELCKELLRFVKSIDPSGILLKITLQKANFQVSNGKK